MNIHWNEGDGGLRGGHSVIPRMSFRRTVAVFHRLPHTPGIVILLLTPYLRVVFSVLYFSFEKDYKYALITLFVLIVLTLSLTLH
jgi:hypothetical protein